MDGEKKYIIELKKGSYTAFDYFFSTYKERLYGFAIGYLKIEDDAKELVQDVFVKLWEHRTMLDENKSVKAYLFTISKNTILNYFRKKANQQLYVEYIKKHIGLSVNTTEEDIEFSDLQEMAVNIVNQLPPRQKMIFKLSREQNLSNEDIADKLSISRKTVENQITLAKKFIRERMGNEKLTMLLFIALFF